MNNSRFDFYMEKKGQKYYLEVKGCTMQIDGIGQFPDAPSSRAVKHVQELIELLNKVSTIDEFKDILVKYHESDIAYALEFLTEEQRKKSARSFRAGASATRIIKRLWLHGNWLHSVYPFFFRLHSHISFLVFSSVFAFGGRYSKKVERPTENISGPVGPAARPWRMAACSRIVGVRCCT